MAAIARFLRRSSAHRRFLPSFLLPESFTSLLHPCPIISHVLPLSPFLSLPQTRCFASPSGGDMELLRVLKEEIEHEKKVDEASEMESKIPPKPFTIKDQPGSQEVFLHRSFHNEDIQVSCLFKVQPYPEPPQEGDMSEGAPSQLVDMTVKIVKGGDDPYLVIRCVTYGEEPVIDRVMYKEVATGVQDLAYEGPEFEDLDSSVKREFVKFLEMRGIDAKFGSFILTYMYHKEQREYSKWLRNVRDFVST